MIAFTAGVPFDLPALAALAGDPPKVPEPWASTRGSVLSIDRSAVNTFGDIQIATAMELDRAPACGCNGILRRCSSASLL